MTPLLWYLDRGAGLVLLALLTAAVVTGLRSREDLASVRLVSAAPARR